MTRSISLFARLSGVLALLAACGSASDPIASRADVGPSAQRDLAPAIADRAAPARDGATSDEAVLRARFEELRLFVEAEIKKQGVPGAAVGVVIRGKLRLAAGVGVKRKGGAEKASERTLFSLGSISKTFTAATALALPGKLGPSDLVLTHLPKLKIASPAASTMTIHHLLTHTSGLGYPSVADYESATLDWNAVETLVAVFEQLSWPLWVEPGKVWNYSNPGFNLVGAAIQRATGKSFDLVLRDLVLSPAAMTDTTASPAAVAKRDRATGHYGGGTVEPGLSLVTPSDGPCNGVYSSAWEMTRFAELLLNQGGGVLDATSVATMAKPQVVLSEISDQHAYGYGLSLQPYRGTTRIGHGGSNMGFTADLAMVPSEGFAVVVLFNSGEGNPSAVTEKALAIFLHHLTAPTPAPQLPTAAELQALVGTYLDSFDLGAIEVALSGGSLVATFKKWGHTTKLVPYARREFGFKVNQAMSDALYLGGWLDFDVAFSVDSGGKGQYFVTRLGVGKRTGS
jgi:CubicO group peptidase (beta-lactamase class C family)